MTSHRKIEANQRNSKKSTGPKSKRGKKMSSINALTTGMYSHSLLLPDENVEAYLALNEDLFEELKPVGRFEEEIVRQIIFDYWRLRRLDRAERSLINRSLSTRLKQAVNNMSPRGSAAWESLIDVPEVHATLMVALEPLLDGPSSLKHLLGKLGGSANEEQSAKINEGSNKTQPRPSKDEQVLALQTFMEVFDLGAALLESIVPSDGGQAMERLDRQRRATRKDILNSYSALKVLQDRRMQELGGS